MYEKDAKTMDGPIGAPRTARNNEPKYDAKGNQLERVHTNVEISNNVGFLSFHCRPTG